MRRFSLVQCLSAFTPLRRTFATPRPKRLRGQLQGGPYCGNKAQPCRRRRVPRRGKKQVARKTSPRVGRRGPFKEPSPNVDPGKKETEKAPMNPPKVMNAQSKGTPPMNQPWLLLIRGSTLNHCKTNDFRFHTKPKVSFFG